VRRRRGTRGFGDLCRVWACVWILWTGEESTGEGIELGRFLVCGGECHVDRAPKCGFKK